MQNMGLVDIAGVFLLLMAARAFVFVPLMDGPIAPENSPVPSTSPGSERRMRPSPYDLELRNIRIDRRWRYLDDNLKNRSNPQYTIFCIDR